MFRIMGVDPAGRGRDKMVISVIDFNWEKKRGKQIALEIFPSTSTPEIEAITRDRNKKYHPFIIAADAIGIGQDLADRFELDNIPLLRIIGGDQATDKDRYYNRRSELYGRLCEWMNPNLGYKLKLIRNPDLMEQFTKLAPMFLSPKEKIRAPSKEEFKKNTGKSPDELDATSYCFIKEEEIPPELFPFLEIHFGKPSQYPKSEWESKDDEEEELENWELGHFGDVPLIDL